MHIAELKTFVVGNPPPAFGGRYFVFLKLRTACGVEGVGEVYAASFAPKAIVAMIEDVFERHVLGMDPFRIEALWRNVYGRGYTLRPDVSLMGVLSGLEMALWDIVGKAVGKPVYELLGGKVHERLRSYTYLYPDEPGSHAYSDSPVYSVPQAAAERALKYLAQGFTAVKFDPAGPYSTFDPRQPSLERLALSEAFCKTLREALGTKCDLLFGTHGQFTASGALRLARRIEPYEPLWFEEPTPPEAPEEMAKVAAQCRMPIATGERLTTKYEFARVLETGAASILQPNLGRVGGLLEAKKIAAMAEAHYAQIAPHLYCGPVVGAANIQLAACSPNFLILESIERWDGFHAKILKKPIRWEDGYVIPPERARPRSRARRGGRQRPSVGRRRAASRCRDPRRSPPRTDGFVGPSVLRAHEPGAVLGAPDVVMQIGDPLAAGGGHRQIFDALLDMGRDQFGKELRIFVDQIGGRLVAELTVAADLLEFGEEGVRLLRIERVAELPDEIRGEHQPRLEIGVSAALEAGRKAGELDRLRDPRRVDLRRSPEPLVGEQFRAIDVIGHQRGVRGAAGQRDLVAGLVDDEFRPGVALQNAAHEADVVQKAGANEMDVVFGHDPVGEHASAQDVAADHRHKHRVFEIVVERVASGDALDGAPRKRPETLGHFVMRRAENVPEIVGKKLPQLLGRRGRDRFHRTWLPNEGGRDCLTMDVPVPM